ncbi:MAG: hypothetical protein G01um101433_139 [Parcubacteria group bacterium Gr01-1014_33]|nr:MAG: hypothetical protein G01um101433_139 [Parcubacteria group bacterium Gr01-1014_33]
MILKCVLGKQSKTSENGIAAFWLAEETIGNRFFATTERWGLLGQDVTPLEISNFNREANSPQLCYAGYLAGKVSETAGF